MKHPPHSKNLPPGFAARKCSCCGATGNGVSSYAINKKRYWICTPCMTSGRYKKRLHLMVPRVIIPDEK